MAHTKLLDVVLAGALLHLLSILNRYDVKVALRRTLSTIVAVGTELLYFGQILDKVMEVLVLLVQFRGYVLHRVMRRTCNMLWLAERLWSLKIDFGWDHHGRRLLLLDLIVHLCGLNIFLIMPLRIGLRFIGYVIYRFRN